MLTIRKEQMAVFREPAINDYVKRMVVHFKRDFSGEVRGVGRREDSRDGQVRHRRTASYGITSEGDVRKYIDLMLMFGLDFDQDTATAVGLCDPRQSGDDKTDHKNQSPLQGTEEAGEARKSKPWRMVWTRSAADR